MSVTTGTHPLTIRIDFNDVADREQGREIRFSKERLCCRQAEHKYMRPSTKVSKQNRDNMLTPQLPFVAILAVSRYPARRHILRHMRRLNNWNYRDVTDFLKENGFSFLEELVGSHERWVKYNDDSTTEHQVEVNFTHGEFIVLQ